MPTIKILGVPHVYDMLGPINSSQALVFVRGWLLSRHYWQSLAELLSSDRCCLCYDLRGFGESRLCEQDDFQQAYTNCRNMAMLEQTIAAQIQARLRSA